MRNSASRRSILRGMALALAGASIAAAAVAGRIAASLDQEAQPLDRCRPEKGRKFKRFDWRRKSYFVENGAQPAGDAHA